MPPPPRRGLHLIELMVVLVIIGVLAALIVPNVLDRADDARDRRARTDIANISQALKLYRLDNQRYPTAEQGLQALIAKPATARCPATGALPGKSCPTTPGATLPVPEPGHQGRSGCDVLRRRRPVRRRGQECRYWQLAVTPPRHGQSTHDTGTSHAGRHRARATRPRGGPGRIHNA